MEMQIGNRRKYLTLSPGDEEWGIVVTTAGFQHVPPRSCYPPDQEHPEGYVFTPKSGRVLNEYQLVYITEGSGYFQSDSVRRQRITAGTVLLLFPGEWHSYAPDSEEGWTEYWVGFRGAGIDRRVNNRFFSPKDPLRKIGPSATLTGLYEDILDFVEREKAGYQQLVSSMALHMLGYIYYKEKNRQYADNGNVELIDRARIMMRNRPGDSLSPEQLAEILGVGYSKFRRMFKDYTGVSPAQYRLQAKLVRAKELLASGALNVSEIAYELGFENASQFSTFFRKREGITPTAFREQIHGSAADAESSGPASDETDVGLERHAGSLR